MEENRSIEKGDVTPYELTPAEIEMLACLAEEAGEIVQAVGKILRHGWESYNPFDETKTTNRRHLEKEINDLGIVSTLLVRQGAFGGDFKESMEHVEVDSDAKIASLKKYLHYTKL